MTRTVLAAIAILATISASQASPRHKTHRFGAEQTDPCMTDAGRYIPCKFAKTYQRPFLGQRKAYADYDGQIIAHPAGCPRIAFCACGASLRVFGRRIKELYRAAAWFRFPRAEPAPGMAAVRNHHVFVIEEVLGHGQVLATDYNSGHHLSRRHVVSLRGYRVVDPHGSTVALR